MNAPKITEKEIAIIKRAKAGEELAFAKLFYKYKKFVESVLYTYIKDKDESEDLANVVFLKVYDKLSMFKNYSSFGGWLRILARNVAIDYLRKKDHIRDSKPLDSDDYLVWMELNTSNENEIVNQITFEKIEDMINSLPEINKKVMVFYYVNNFKVTEIAKQLSMPVNTVKSILFRARKQIKKQLKL